MIWSKVNLDWCRRISHLFSLLRGSGREKTSHITFLIICSWHWSLYDLMGIAGFPYLGIPLNLAEPAYLEHVSSVFLFSLMICERNLPLCIGPLQFLNYSSYWSPGTIQSLFYLDQVKQPILASGSVTDQGTKEWSSYLYNRPHRGEYILYPDPSTLSDHLITTIVDLSTSGAWLLIIVPSGAKSSICIDSCFSS